MKISNPFYNEENSREYEGRSYLSKGSYNSDSAGNPIPAAQGTFGWGGVYREYPTKYTLTYDSDSKKIKGGCTRVYRYVGR